MLRDELRLHTRAHHEHIERLLDLPDSILDEADYIRLLSGLYGFYVSHEARLRLHESSLYALKLDLDMRLKTPKLREDLLACGLGEREILALPLCPNVPQLLTWQDALGSMYVSEGSTLGGQIIARALRSRLHLDPEAQMNFLLSYGGRTRAMWRSFVETLNAIELASGERANVLAAASETFQSMESWLAFTYLPARHAVPHRVGDYLDEPR